MNFSTTTNTFGKIGSNTSTVFKAFKELKIAIWKNQKLADAVLVQSEGNNPREILRQYTLPQAAKFLGKSEAAFRLFLWESTVSADGESSDGSPLFSEDLLDLIDSYGYLFEYSKKWSSTGHYAEAHRLLNEAHQVFGIKTQESSEQPSHKKKVKNRPVAISQYREDWGGVPEIFDTQTASA